MLFLNMIVTSCLPEGRLLAVSIIKHFVLDSVTLLVYGLMSIFCLLIVDRNVRFWFFEHLVEGRKVLRHFYFTFLNLLKYLHLALIGRKIKLRGVLSDTLASC